MISSESLLPDDARVVIRTDLKKRLYRHKGFEMVTKTVQLSINVSIGHHTFGKCNTRPSGVYRWRAARISLVHALHFNLTFFFRNGSFSFLF